MSRRLLVLIVSCVVPLVSLSARKLTLEGAGTASAAPDTGENQFGVSLTLFATLAAINAAGYDAGIDSPLNERYKVRTQIREALAARPIASLPELKSFYKEHKKPTETGDLSQYISFALVAGAPPTFELGEQVPPDVEPLRGLSPLLARFYKEAKLEELWNRSQNAYTAAISEYQDPVIGTIFEANGYLRNASGYLGRRFQIYLDLLAAPDQAQVRSYKNDYYIVISPTSTPVVEEIRDAYLSYLLDPLPFKYTTAVKDKRSLAKYAQDAPALDLAYKDDFALLLNKSLIKAIDSRLMHVGAEKREATVNDAMRQGYILTAEFADLLPAYEKQQEAFRVYYPELITAIDVRRVQKQLKGVEFVQSVKQRVIAPPSTMQISAAEQSLQAAEGFYEGADYPNASKLFKKVFEQTDDKSMKGRAYYGLARIAVHENRKNEAIELFERTAENNPGPALSAWAHVYLGRLALASGDFEKAGTQFKIALGTEGASPTAREAAETGLRSSSSTGEKQP